MVDLYYIFQVIKNESLFNFYFTVFIIADSKPFQS